jgi:hypothetical protein
MGFELWPGACRHGAWGLAGTENGDSVRPRCRTAGSILRIRKAFAAPNAVIARDLLIPFSPLGILGVADLLDRCAYDPAAKHDTRRLNAIGALPLLQLDHERRDIVPRPGRCQNGCRLNPNRAATF